MRATVVVLAAAVVYIAAWLIGLVVAPARPGDGAAPLRQYFIDHAGAAVTQSLLVHGVAGLALATFVAGLARVLTAAGSGIGTSRAVLVLGVGAAALSLVQVALLLSVAPQAGSLTDQLAADRVAWIDYVDVAKLGFLAALAVTATRAAGAVDLVGSWVTPAAYVLAALLVLGGLSFVVDWGVLTVALFVSLPLLLVWVGTLGVAVYRSAPDGAGLHAAEPVR